VTATAVLTHRRVAPLGHVAALEGLRGVAVGLVVAHHLLAGDRGLWVGVDLFFVLSGFLITSVVAARWSSAEGLRLGPFYAARARRILPMLVVVVLAYVVVVRGLLGAGAPFPLDQLLALPHENVRSALEGPVNPHLGHLWTIAAEVQFYLVWPLVLLVLLRRGVAASRILGGLLLALAGVVALRLALSLGDSAWFTLYYSPLTRADGFLLGCAAGVVAAWGGPRRSPPLRRALRALVVPAAAVLVWFAAAGGVTTDLPYRGGLLLAAAAAATLVLAAGAGATGPAASVLVRRPVRLLGRISYSLYLWHLPVLAAVTSVLPHHRTARLTTTVVVSVALSAVTYGLVERPFLRTAPPVTARRPLPLVSGA
jgi:peptidoglycan/LPS O-acetylase OafA/YrhL